MNPDPETILAERLDQLSLPQKVLLLTGRDFWTTWPMPEIGLRSMVLSDGPSGVRGEVWDERSPSINFPSAAALSSSWDEDIAERYGRACAVEARRKGVDVVLGPTVNLHRSPLGGRNFESFSEDPHLTGRLAAAYVRGVQSHGVAATPKHYVANDFETERFTADVAVDESTLREVYLRPFEVAVGEAGAWALMSAYNSVNGTTMSENDLLDTPLRTEWGFDGVVVSDWSAVRNLDSARVSQDLVMPGPDGPWGDALVAAVENGEIDESVVDRKVLNILRLAARVGALDGVGRPGASPPAEDGVAFAREAAAEGSVLLINNGVLPLASPLSIAVIGHNAQHSRTQGGGSATVVPERVVSALDGIRRSFPDADVSYSVGAIVQEELSPLEPAAMTNPETGGRGARVVFRDAAGDVLVAEDRLASNLAIFNGTVPLADVASIDFACVYTPTEDADVRLGFAGVGAGLLSVDDELVLEHTLDSVGPDLGAAFLAPPAVSVPCSFRAGEARRIAFTLTPVRQEGSIAGALSFTVGCEPPQTDPDALIAEAAAAASAADVAVVVVGTNSRVESEGHDRDHLSLPGNQDALVRAVAAANPRIVVVVNAGAPVLTPWADDVAAVLVTYFGGQEAGNALGDVLSGRREPGGRLPTTWPASESDVPTLGIDVRDGVVEYDEGVNVGYRAWLRSGAEPAFPFGHGQGFTTWTVDSVDTELRDEHIEVVVHATNIGARDGKHVVQVYAERADSDLDRPARWLVGHAVLRASGGTSASATISVPTRELARWRDVWVVEPGSYPLLVGRSVTHIDWTGAVNL